MSTDEQQILKASYFKKTEYNKILNLRSRGLVGFWTILSGSTIKQFASILSATAINTSKTEPKEHCPQMLD